MRKNAFKIVIHHVNNHRMINVRRLCFLKKKNTVEKAMKLKLIATKNQFDQFEFQNYSILEMVLI